MLPYTAYLRVYEPLAGFAEPERSGWAAYAESADRPRRATALDVEHAEALRRLAAAPPVPVPAEESRDAYIRKTGETVYVCPWQTRLRSWAAFTRLRAGLPAEVLAAFVPGPVTDRVVRDFQRWNHTDGPVRTHIRSSTWHVPLAWFVPFVPAERSLVLSSQQEAGGGGPATAVPTRTLLYVTSMAEARRRVARACRVAETITREHPDADPGWAEVETIGRWLAEFHAGALVELDYGGLVHLFDDQALRTDESVAEVSVALAGMEQGKTVLTLAMHQRFLARWRSVRALESAN
ncbi:MAG: hypothetical protein ACRDOO_20465 [Actinomadura sp.]